MPSGAECLAARDSGPHSDDMRPDLRSELLRRAQRDRAARGRSETGWESVVAVDAENLAWLRHVVAEIGWPGRSMVGGRCLRGLASGFRLGVAPIVIV